METNLFVRARSARLGRPRLPLHRLLLAELFQVDLAFLDRLAEVEVRPVLRIEEDGRIRERLRHHFDLPQIQQRVEDLAELLPALPGEVSEIVRVGRRQPGARR
jgi:hypothetical protein